jgi:membrane fusion protein (multidrug efflux system)
MPTEIVENKGNPGSIDAPAKGRAADTTARDGKSPQTDLASQPVPPAKQGFTRRRKLLFGVLGAVLIAAAVYGIPWIRFVLSTVSTDDAYVNGHVTFVAPRVHGQVARVLVDDNNRVHKGDLLVELDKEPFRDAVAVKKAAVDTAQADLQAASATVRGMNGHQPRSVDRVSRLAGPRRGRSSAFQSGRAA